MATEKLEELTIEQLKKKDKGVSKLLLLILVIFIICILVMIFSIIKGNSIAALVPSACLLFIVSLPLVNGRKKIKEELKKKETKV